MHPLTAPPRVDRAALARDIETVMAGINRFGVDPSGGWTRPAFSDPDMAARRWLRNHCHDRGLAAEIDPIGNVVARWGNGDLPPVMVGSHTDTVIEGGAFDGVFGVAAGVAAVEALRAAGHTPARPIEIVSFADEEGRFGGMLGSQSFSGQVSTDWLHSARDADGVPLINAMAAQGLNADAATGLKRAPHAFLEAHVEQGPVLEAAGVSVGVVPSITGVRVTQSRLVGEADHSGTTPMDQRRDALAAAASAIAALPMVLANLGAPDARATIGKLNVWPNTPHTIPGVVEFTAVLRDADAKTLMALEHAFTATVAQACAAHSVAVTTTVLSTLLPVQLDAHLCALATDAARSLGLTARTLPSGAGHDAQSMQAVCPSALLFAPSRGGISHAPTEHTDLADLADVTAVLTEMLATLT